VAQADSAGALHDPDDRKDDSCQDEQANDSYQSEGDE